MDNTYTYLDGADFLSIKEFAILIRVHPNTIRRSIKAGKISAMKIGEGKKAVYRIARAEINRLTFVYMEAIIEKLIDKKMGEMELKK